MMRRAVVAALLASASLSGCVSTSDSLMADARAAASQPVASLRGNDALGGTTDGARPEATMATDPLDQPAPDSMRWLYGSGEAAGASIQAYRMLADYAIGAAAAKPARSVEMGLPDAAGGTGTVDCRKPDGSTKQPAVVFDVDETVILNSGFEYWTALGHPYDSKSWDEWAANGAPFVAPVPGAVTGLRRLREAGIAVVYNTNRDARYAKGTAAAIAAAGLGPATHFDTLFLKGDDAMGGRKDGRRATIAARYCVVALAGDNLGDFADVFNDSGLAPQARRELAARGRYAQLWGNGWFALPNPVYGESIKGNVGDVFPPDARWQPGIAGDAPNP
ncbi:5'-nucleotidase, lipoprotein e(P4) family [Erythrobacter sp. 3-20A1M]|uniref:5'-nucleotidase, lipoprotein e(P4) family n=1 Tax=Erythrobacter sp. 3-20A1M TaxID=2653850 RepID=UPI00203F3A5E|nr:HAD family acid phosphatase [Erythrobacter sp. 3-20A1M]